MKKVYKSRTVWVNVLALIAVVAQELAGENVFSAELQLAVLAALNAVLRFRTTEAIG